MNKAIEFINESIDEVKTKVTWPTYRELQNSSTLVLIASLVFAIIIGTADIIIESAMKIIYSL